MDSTCAIRSYCVVQSMPSNRMWLVHSAIITVDLSIHFERGEDDLHAARLHEIFASFDCSQHVPNTPTHRDGGTLDLVITKSEQVIDDADSSTEFHLRSQCDHMAR